MKNFDFRNAKTLKSAIKILSELQENALLVAGGTNVMVDIRAEKINNRTLVNIRDIAELKGIHYRHGEVSIGSMTTLAEMSVSNTLKKHAPGLFGAACVFADPTTNRLATIGGNVGNASASGDTIPPLMVLDATVHLMSVRGERQVNIFDFIVKNGVTTRKPDEIITKITFKSQPKTGFIKLGPRKSMCISIATAAAYVDVDKSGVVKDCRIAMGGVAAVTVRGKHTEKALMGKKLTDDIWEKVGGEVQKDISPRDPSVRAAASYRRAVVPVLVKRAVNLAAFGECMGEVKK